jgi:hypothetical protein
VPTAAAPRPGALAVTLARPGVLAARRYRTAACCLGGPPPAPGLVEALTGGPVSLSGTTSDLVREESPRVAKRRRSLTYRLA